MSSIKHRRAFTSAGVFAVLAACSVGACNKSDSGDDGTDGGTTSGGSGAGGSSGASSAGKAGQGAAEAGETGNGGTGVGGSGTAGTGAGGADAGASGAEDAGAPSTAGTGGSAGSGGTGTAGHGGTGGSGTAGTAGSGGSGGACTANTQTDKNNCGRCGKSCAGGDCSGGECTPVVVLDPKTDSTGLTTKTILNALNVYEWQTTDDPAFPANTGRYRSLRASVVPVTPPTPGIVISDIPDAAPFVGSVTFDATSLYQCSSAGVTKVALSATAAAPTALFKAPTIAGGFECSNITVSATAAYVTHHDFTMGKESFYSVALPPANANVQPVLIPNIGARDTPVHDVAVIGTRLFWMEHDLAGSSEPKLVYAPVTGLPAGGMPTTVDTDLGSTQAAIASDATYLYWTNTHSLGTSVRRAPLNSLVPTSFVEVISGLDTVNEGIALDATYVYVMEGQSREVFRAKKDGTGTADALGTALVDDTNGQHLGFAMTGVDANFVYFQLDDGLIARLPNAP